MHLLSQRKKIQERAFLGSCHIAGHAGPCKICLSEIFSLLSCLFNCEPIEVRYSGLSFMK